MNKVSEKTTLYIDPQVKKLVQFYALRDNRSLSAIVNEKLAEYLEDMADAASIESRKNEPTAGFEQVVKELGLSLNDIQNHAKKERTKRTHKT